MPVSPGRVKTSFRRTPKRVAFRKGAPGVRQDDVNRLARVGLVDGDRLGAAQGRGRVDAAADHVRQKIDPDLRRLGESGEAQQAFLQVRRAVPVVAARLVDGLRQGGGGPLDLGQIVAVERADQRLVRTGQSIEDGRVALPGFNGS